MIEWSMIVALTGMCILGLLLLTYINFKFTRQLLDSTFKQFQDQRHRDYLESKDREFRSWKLMDDMANRVMSRNYSEYALGKQPPPEVAEEPEEEDPDNLLLVNPSEMF